VVADLVLGVVHKLNLLLKDKTGQLKIEFNKIGERF
jgi:hypothetical protein